MSIFEDELDNFMLLLWFWSRACWFCHDIGSLEWWYSWQRLFHYLKLHAWIACSADSALTNSMLYETIYFLGITLCGSPEEIKILSSIFTSRHKGGTSRAVILMS